MNSSDPSKRRTKKITPEYKLIQESKIPPQDQKTERDILAVLMTDSDKPESQKVLQVLKPEHFYSPANQVIGDAILFLWQKDAPIDCNTVVNHLRHTGKLDEVGGPTTIATLINGSLRSANIFYWFASILYPAYLKRKMIEVGVRVVSEAYEDKYDTFDMLDTAVQELEKCKLDVVFKASHSAKSAGEAFMDEMGLNEVDPEKEQEMKFPIKRYPIGLPQFDEIVTTCQNKIVLLASHKAGLKSRFSNFWVTSLAEKYPDDISCFWVSLEDSVDEQIRIYLSRKLRIIPDKIKFRMFDNFLRPNMAKLMKTWNSFDFKIVDQAIKVKEIQTAFKIFCAERQGRLCILVIDNILSLADLAENSHNDQNKIYDYIGNVILDIKRSTHGLVIPIHHFNEDVADKRELVNGYRPRLVNLKGTEVWKRISYQNILINYPKFYKDLVAETKGDYKTILEYLWIMDVSTNRSRKELDEDSIIRFWAEPNFCEFKEIDPKLEVDLPEEVEAIKINISSDLSDVPF